MFAKTPNKLKLMIGLSVSVVCFVLFYKLYLSPASLFVQVIPHSVIQGQLTEYSVDEIKLIRQDLNNIRQFFLGNRQTQSSPLYVATAGGPGASKSTILENYIKEHPQADFAYVDPDQAALKYMFTYIHEKSNDVIATHQLDQKDYAEVTKRAYNKWRAASNFIANTLLNEAVQRHLNISHGTTSTGNKIEELHQKLKRNGYKIVLLLCGSSDANREASLTHREQVQAFYQSTHSDCVEKGKLFYTRFPDYFTSADEIEMYWTDNFLKGSQKVATFNKKSGLTVIDADGFNKFKKEYEDNKTENYPPLAALTAY